MIGTCPACGHWDHVEGSCRQCYWGPLLSGKRSCESRLYDADPRYEAEAPVRRRIPDVIHHQERVDRAVNRALAVLLIVALVVLTITLTLVSGRPPQ